MGYRQVGCLEQIWYVLKHTISQKIEWQDAKCWAEEYHPAWVQLATKARSKEVRLIYRDKILKAYRGEMEYG